MGYNDQSEYPRGVFSVADLDVTPQDIGTPSKPVRLASLQVQSPPAGTAIDVILRSTDNATEYARLSLAAGESDELPGPLYCSGGLEVLTSGAAGDIIVNATYWTD